METTDMTRDFLNGLDTDPNESSGSEEIRKAAHIVNGGEATFPCPACKGTGRWGYSGRSCFKCAGKGKVSKGVAAAAKGKATKATNLAQWRADHADVISYINRRVERGSTFYAKLAGDLDQWGTLFDSRIDMIRKDMEADTARLQEWRAAKDAETASLSGSIGVERINALFATALGSGLKKPVFRTEHLTIKPARQHPGTLYVTDSRIEDRERGGPAYVGKIVEDRFEASRDAKPDTLDLLCEIAADPQESAIKYGRATGNCGCCGRELTDPISVANGIGPICASKWGF